MPVFLLAGALGAALAYFFDPDNGNRRRKLTADKAGKYFRSTSRLADDVAAQARTVKQKATHLKEQDKPQPNDVTLAQKVESEIFRDVDVPKGQINVNAEDGVVFLRGEADTPELIDELEAKTRKVKGVRGVENLLHLPEAPARTES
jgi:osmotically-inducible protein OsmY